MFDRIKNSPYPLGGVTFGWVNAVYIALDHVFNHEVLKSLNTPVLVVGTHKDTVVDCSAFGKWVEHANRCSKSSVQLSWIDGGLHELLAEDPKYRDPTLEHIKSWFVQFLKN